MSPAYLITFELITITLLIFCLQHAKKRGWGEVWQLLAGVVFGWLLEWGTILQLNAYEYGDFLLKVGPLPLSVGIGWGIIIYAARLFSDASNLPRWTRPILDAFLALNIDLAMDAVAIRLGMWDWGRGLTFEYFGVPYANFWAWFWVVFSFSASLRLLNHIKGKISQWLAPSGAIILGTLGVLGTNSLIVDVLAPAGYYEISILLVMLVGLGLIVSQRPKFHLRYISPLAFWVPFTFHAYFLIAGVISGVIFHPAILLFVSILMLVISLLLHHKGTPLPKKIAH